MAPFWRFKQSFDSTIKHHPARLDVLLKELVEIDPLRKLGSMLHVSSRMPE